MNDELTRDFKGIWIPKDIWLDDRLNTIDKIILLEIDSLDCNDDGCFASNEYLAKFCNCNEWTVSTSITKLVKLEYIDIVKFDGRKRYIKSRLGKIQRQPWEIHKAALGNSQDINILNNISDNNNKYNIYGEFKNVKLSDQEYQKLKDKNLLPYIEKLSSYIASKGKKYKSHYATILTWSRKETKEHKTNVVATPKWFNESLNKEEITTQEQNEIENILKEIGE